MTKNSAIKYFGTQAALARVLGINYQAVQNWPDVLSRGISDRIELAILKDKARKDVLSNK